MFVINFVVAHWAISLVAYLALTSWSAITIIRSNGMRELCSRFPRLRHLFRVGFLLLGYMLGIPFTILFIYTTYQECKEKRERERKEAESVQRAQEEREKKEKQNQHRADARKRWLVNNRPQLFFNTVNGITAVLRPADLEAIQKETERARVNETWVQSTLMLAPRTFVFVTQSGRETIRTNYKQAEVYKVAGWRADLNEVCQKADCQLMRDETIFVPWVNESLVPFESQYRCTQDSLAGRLFEELIEKQMPAEIQRL
jgi:hypothetical protein